MKYTNDCVHVTSTSTGLGLPVVFAGTAYRNDDAMAMLVIATVQTTLAHGFRGGQRFLSNARIIITKQAPDPEALGSYMKFGISRTRDGRQHVVTMGAAGSSVKYIERLPYDDQGRLRINEIA